MANMLTLSIQWRHRQSLVWFNSVLLPQYTTLYWVHVQNSGSPTSAEYVSYCKSGNNQLEDQDIPNKFCATFTQNIH